MLLYRLEATSCDVCETAFVGLVVDLHVAEDEGIEAEQSHGHIGACLGECILVLEPPVAESWDLAIIGVC